MPYMSSTDATFHTRQDLIYALQNPEPTRSLVRLGNVHKDSLRTLAEIFIKPNPPEVPLRVTVRRAFQEKTQQVNQEIIQTKIASQSKPFTNAEPLRVTIVEAYPEEPQSSHPQKTIIFQPSKNSAATPRKMKISKNNDWKNKSVYIRIAAPCDTRSG